MRGKPSVWRRTQVLEERHRSAEYERAARIMCELEEVDPVAHEADCRRWEKRFRQEGAVTTTQKTAVVAAEIGCTVEELEAETRELVARTTAAWEAGRP